MELDDLPVGSKPGKAGGDPFGSEFPDQDDSTPSSSNKSLSDRLVSKKWNERAGAYEELCETIKQVKNSKDPLFGDHAESFKKYLSDSNPGALEKAVDLFIQYVDKASDGIIKEIQPIAIDLLITKSVSHMKPSLQEKGMEAICAIIENTDGFEEVAECVSKTFSSSNVKVS